MNGYEQRRADKAERLRGYADSAAKRAEAASKSAHAIMDMIPLGQPILVGHHSERHARRDIAKIDAGFERAAEERERAERNNRRAATIESGIAISSWDPEAAGKIQERIAELEAERARIKAVNIAVRKVGLAAADIPDADKRELVNLMRICPWEKVETRGYPAYKLTNMGGNIRRLQERQKTLQRQTEQAPPGFLKVVPNKWSGTCEECGAKVEARAGFYARDTDGNAGVRCAECMRPA